jgi:hypothetical protein
MAPKCGSQQPNEDASAEGHAFMQPRPMRRPGSDSQELVSVADALSADLRGPPSRRRPDGASRSAR